MITPEIKRHAQAAVGLCLLGLLAFHNGFDAPFTPDDEAAILLNPQIRQLSPIDLPDYHVQSPLSGRPMSRFSLAITYALGEWQIEDIPLLSAMGVGKGGLQVRGYHVGNFVLHAASAWLLYALCLWTLRLPLRQFDRWREHAAPLSMLVAAIWVVHPLQVDAVTYVTQRTELLVGFFYLVVMLAALAAATRPHAQLWTAVAVVACLLGVLSKEVMASAPIMVVLYDRAFLYHDWYAAWRRRRRLYSGLAATWLVQVPLILSGPSDDTIGFDLGVSWWEYAVTQVGVVTYYLRLSAMPLHLNIDYGRELVASEASMLLSAAFLGTVLWFTVGGLWRQRQAAFLGAWVFLILAPSSSVVPIVTEIAAERRMHLPLAALIVVVVLALHRLCTGGLAKLRDSSADEQTGSSWQQRMMLGGGLLVGAMAVLTLQRNAIFTDHLLLWSDSVAKSPHSCSARNNLGRAHFDRGQLPEAIASFSAALQLRHCDPVVNTNYAKALVEAGRVEEAIQYLGEVTQRLPGFWKAYESLGIAYLRLERWEEAVAEFERCLENGYRSADLHVNVGMALYQLGQVEATREHMLSALRLDPEHRIASDNLQFLAR